MIGESRLATFANAPRSLANSPTCLCCSPTVRARMSTTRHGSRKTALVDELYSGNPDVYTLLLVFEAPSELFLDEQHAEHRVGRRRDIEIDVRSVVEEVSRNLPGRDRDAM